MFDIAIDAREIGLVEHAEFDFFGLFLFFLLAGGGRGGVDGDVEVEGTLEDGGVGDGVDVCKREELEGFFETEEDSEGEKEEEACNFRSALNTAG